MKKYFIILLLILNYSSDLICQNYIKIDLEHFDSIYYDSNKNVTGYDILPNICHIDNDTIYFSISEINQGVKIWKFVNEKLIEKVKIEGDTGYIYFDFIRIGVKYIRFFKRDREYYLDKNKLSFHNTLSKMPSLEMNNYLKGLSHNSFNYSSKNYLKHLVKIDYNNEIRTVGLDTIPISIFPIQKEMQYYNDNGKHKVLMYSLKYAIIFPIETDSWINDELKRIKIRRNAIFAYYGRTFKTEWLNEYFNSQFWYKPNPDYSDDMLNEYDKEEIQILLKLEKEIENKKNTDLGEF